MGRSDAPRRRLQAGAWGLVLLLLGACTAVPVPPSNSSGAPAAGAYYLDDGPGSPPPNLDAVPDAVPRDEPLLASANRPYTVFGVNYVPQPQVPAYRARGTASWYGKKFHGRRTASGERYDMYGMTAAHPTLPIPSYVRVTNLRNGRSVVVRINDRGPFLHRRLIDLSYTAALKLGYAHLGTASVEVQRVFADDEPPPALARRRPPAGPAVAVLADASAETAVVQRLAPTAASESAAQATDQEPEPPASLTLESLTETPPPAAPAAPSAPPEEGPAPQVERGEVWLQLGAFSSRPNAEQALTRAHRAVVGRGTGLILVQRGALWRVHMGPWTDRAEAQAMAERMAAQGLAKPVIVTP